MTKYGVLSWGEFLSLSTKLARLPLVLSRDVLKYLIWDRRSRSLVKTAVISSLRHLLTNSTVPQLQYATGTTASNYAAWTRRHGLPFTVEELIDDSALYWIGPKCSDKVVLYVHGGGYWGPIQDCAISFWNYAREQLKLQGHGVGFAILRYTLLPDATFPTQLRQLTVAVDHLLATGTDPRNLHLAGDSAGGNLILQFLSQLLHPIDNIGPTTKLQAPLAGLYLMSPWVTLESKSESFLQPGSFDIIDAPSIDHWAKGYSQHVPDSRRQYIDALSASDVWFKGASKFTSRILISAGGDEIFKDDIVQFAESKLSKDDVELQLEVQEHGVHDDPFYDFFVSDRPSSVGTLSPVIIDWLKDGFEKP